MKQKQDENLQKEKKLFVLQQDHEKTTKLYQQQASESSRSDHLKSEMGEQMQELMERLRMTEHQLITVKSSWAESEQEREQMITQIQEQDDSIGALKEQV